MQALRRLATSVGATRIDLPSGTEATIQTWTVSLPLATPARLTEGILSRTYTSKPLVDVNGEGVFGEIALVRLLGADDWRAVWADTFHGKKFWMGMPTTSNHVVPPPQVKALYDRIAEVKGSASGCFDVISWKRGRVIWLEYKGPKDRPNVNESLWIDAALKCGVRQEDLIFVGAKGR